MMVLTLVVGIGLILAGLLAVGFGIPVKEFSFGNTLILTGVMAGCTGFVMLGLWMAVRELKAVARRLSAGIPVGPGEATALQPTRPPAAPRGQASTDAGLLFTRDQMAAEGASGAEPVSAGAPPPWHEEAASRGVRNEVPAVPATAPEPVEAAPKRRNLLFSSSSRKERERAQARASEPLTPDLLTPELRPNPPAVPPAAEPAEPPSATFDDAWPKLDRSKAAEAAPPRRSPRAPSTFNDANGAAEPDRPLAPREEQPPVTVLKSGVVDGMAYSLYSDGSIEAQMPEGMMRFASIDELRSHLDQRP
jgi:hypothetical protein